MVLLDTCVLIFDALAPRRLSAKARRTIEDADRSRDLAVSDITLWEVAMLAGHGRLDPGTDASTFLRLALEARSIDVLPITPEIAARSAGLRMHGDPADRIIAACAVEHGALLVTPDRELLKVEGLRSIW